MPSRQETLLNGTRNDAMGFVCFASLETFEEGKNQLSGSKVQSEHRQDNSNIDNPTSSGAKRKVTSIRAISQSQCCPYSFLLYFVQKNNLQAENGIFQDYIIEAKGYVLRTTIICQ
jgi:hypothetical protein